MPWLGNDRVLLFLFSWSFHQSSCLWYCCNSGKKTSKSYIVLCPHAWNYLYVLRKENYTLFTNSPLGVNNVHCITRSWGPRKLISYFITLWIRWLRTTGIKERTNPLKLISFNWCSWKFPFYFLIGLHLHDDFWSRV